MSEHLLINPDLLYKIYSYNQIEEYYGYNFLPEFTSFDVNSIYDSLNCITLKELQCLQNHIVKQWSLTHMLLSKETPSPKKRYNSLIQTKYPNIKITDKQQLNDILIKFINDDKIKAIYIINKILKFLYPC